MLLLRQEPIRCLWHFFPPHPFSNRSSSPVHSTVSVVLFLLRVGGGQTSSVLLFYSLIFFNWSIIALRVSFCCIVKWISYIIPISLPYWVSFPPLPSRSSQSPSRNSFAIQQLPLSCFPHGSVCVCINSIFSIHPTFPFPLCIHLSILHICVSISAL